MKHKKILASLLASLCLVSFGLSNFVSTNIPGVSIVVRADSNEEYVRAFVNRMYNIVLEREAEQEGLDVWTHEILSGSKTGAQLVEAFFFSDEFLNKDKSDADFLDLLYLATFNRDADAKGKENWLSQIDAGMSRREVINEFIISPEFAAICNNYGITAGTINLEENVNSKREYATSFVKRMYNIVLNREAEPDGLKVWTNEITTGSKTGAQLVEAFFFSDEFLGKNTTNSEFLDLLYLATFNREADAAGKANWLAHLDRDMTRRNVINEFVTSPEFANICKKYDITAGSLTLDNGLDKNFLVNNFVKNYYLTLFERQPDIASWSKYVTSINDGSSTAIGVFESMLYSSEFTNRNLNEHDYIAVLYKALLGREASEAEISTWQSYGFSRARILQHFVDSEEFKARCSAHSVPVGSINKTLCADKTNQEFIALMYKQILGREVDPSGDATWRSTLNSGAAASDFVKGLFNCDEYKNNNFSNKDFVTNVYSVLLNRTPSTDEINTLCNLLENCMVTRDYVVGYVYNSNEFQKKYLNFGVKLGTYSSGLARDKNVKVNPFVINMYESLLGRIPTGTELDEWCAHFTSNNTSCEAFVNSLVKDSAFTKLSTENKVKALFVGCMNRNPSTAEVSALTDMYNKSGLSAVIKYIIGSTEFKNVCNKYGILPDYTYGWNNTSEGRKYYSNGKFLSGWQRIDGSRYYFDPNTKVAASGWKYVNGLRYYFDPSTNKLIQNVDSIIGKQSSYYIKVNCATNVVTIYARSSKGGSYDTPVKVMTCSTGLSSSPTKKGTFTIRRQSRWGLLVGSVYGQYITRISGNYLFHSSWYYKNGDIRSLSIKEYNMLGNNASHGCVRLCVADSKWIYENCDGSTAYIYSDPNEVAPFDKPVLPKPIVVSGDRGIDPTDPNR